MGENDGVRYVKAFVGMYGHDDSGIQLRESVYSFDENDTPLQLSYPSGAVQVTGTRSATQAFQVDNGSICVKGRPFSLSRDGDSAPLEFPKIAEQLADLDGRFCLCAFFQDALVLATDLIAASGMFYCVDDKSRLIFSTHLGLLLRALPERPALSDQGVVCTLAGGCSLAGRTPYQGVYRLGAGQFLSARINNGAVAHEIVPYLDVAAVLVDPYPSGDDPGRTLERLLCESLSREVRHEEVGVMLSGGKDSQALAQGLLLSGFEGFPAATFGEWRSKDVRGARRFAKETGLRHTVISYRDWTFENYAPLILSLGGGICGFQTAHNLVGYDRARGRLPLGVVGYLGEVLSGVHVRVGKDHDEIAFPFRNRWNPAFTDAYGEILAELIAEVNDLAGSYHGLSAVQRGVIIDILVRQATWISSAFDLCDWLLPLAYPFYSRDLLRFFFNLSAEQLQGQKLYTQWLQSSYPRCRQRNKFSLSWLMYEGTQQFLDRISWRTGFFQISPLIAWEHRIEAEKEWLGDLVAGIADPKLRSVCEGQDFNQREGIALLIGASLGAASARL